MPMRLDEAFREFRESFRGGQNNWLIRLTDTKNSGISNRILSGQWSAYFQSRDFVADYFASNLGFGEELADYLDT